MNILASEALVLELFLESIGIPDPMPPLEPLYNYNVPLSSTSSLHHPEHLHPASARMVGSSTNLLLHNVNSMHNNSALSIPADHSDASSGATSLKSSSLAASLTGRGPPVVGSESLLPRDLTPRPRGFIPLQPSLLSRTHFPSSDRNQLQYDSDALHTDVTGASGSRPPRHDSTRLNGTGPTRKPKKSKSAAKPYVKKKTIVAEAAEVIRHPIITGEDQKEITTTEDVDDTALSYYPFACGNTVTPCPSRYKNEFRLGYHLNAQGQEGCRTDYIRRCVAQKLKNVVEGEVGNPTKITVVRPDGVRKNTGENQRISKGLDPGQVRVRALLSKEERRQVEAIRKRNHSLQKRRRREAKGKGRAASEEL